MKNNNEHALSDVLKEFVRSFNIQDRLTELSITEKWGKIMGQIIYKHTINIYLKEKTLYVTLDSPGLKNELQFAKSKMIKIINNEFGTNIVVDIIIR